MNSKTLKLLILNSAIALVWIISVLIFTSLQDKGFCFYCALICMVLATVIANISLYLIKAKRDVSLFEVNAIGVVVSEAYLIASVIANTVFVSMDKDVSKKIPVIVNLVILLVFMGMRLYTDSYIKRVDDSIGKLNAKNDVIKYVKGKTAELVTVSCDDDIKKASKKLKETVDYSSNVSCNYEIEMEFCRAVDDVISGIKNNAGKTAVLEGIGKASDIWAKRNITEASRR